MTEFWTRGPRSARRARARARDCARAARYDARRRRPGEGPLRRAARGGLAGRAARETRCWPPPWATIATTTGCRACRRGPGRGRRPPRAAASSGSARSTAPRCRARTASATTCSRASSTTTSPTSTSAPGASRSTPTAASTPTSRSCPARVPLADRARLRELRRAPARLARATCAQQIAHMREGLRTGFTLPRVVLEGYDVTIRAHVVDAPDEERLLGARSRAFPPACREADRERLRAAGREAVIAGRGGRLPRASCDFFDERVPARRARHHRRLRAARRPRLLRAAGAHVHDARRSRPRRSTRSASREVARIRGRDGRRSCARPASRATSPAFLEFLRTDPRFYAKTPDELLKEASWIAKRMDGKLPALFGRLPRLPYGVEPVPDAPRAQVHRRPLRRRRRSAARGRASTGSTPTRWRAGRSTTWRR